jgi:hypothetical protein
MLGLTGQGVRLRRKQPDFPEPLAQLACGPIWRREDIVAYAKARCERYYERAAIEELASEDVAGVLSVAEAAEALGVSEGEVERLSVTEPSLPRRREIRTGTLLGIPADGLVLWHLALIERQGAQGYIY